MAALEFMIVKMNEGKKERMSRCIDFNKWTKGLECASMSTNNKKAIYWPTWPSATKGHGSMELPWCLSVCLLVHHLRSWIPDATHKAYNPPVKQRVVAALPATKHSWFFFCMFRHNEHCDYVIFVPWLGLSQQVFVAGQYNLNSQSDTIYMWVIWAFRLKVNIFPQLSFSINHITRLHMQSDCNYIYFD